MPTVLITGGTGMIGEALTNALLKKDYEVIIITRNKKNALSLQNVTYAEWNITQQMIDQNAINKAHYIIHLAGANLAEGRWTKKRKQEIRDSRIRSGALLVKALKEIPNNIKAVISSSAIGWYGPDAERQKPFIESEPSSNDFLGQTCQEWEDAIRPITALGKRLVLLRTGIVLSNKGGAYAEFKKPLHFGIAAVLGNGRQVVSWIHIDDLVEMYITALENENLNGVYNAVAPHPVTNKELIKTMANTKGNFHFTAPVPAFALKVALGEMSIEVLKSATVSAEKVIAAGFHFQYPTIESAIRQLEAS